MKASAGERAKGCDRSSEQIAAAKFANDRRAKGSFRSSEQIAAIKAANDKRAKGINRSSEEIAAAKEANDKRERAQGSDRSAEQIKAAKTANEERAQGSDRSSNQVYTVKRANKEYYDTRPTKYEAQERERRDSWAKFKRSQRTRLMCLIDDGILLYNEKDFRGALSALKDALKLIPDPQNYVHEELLSYFQAHYYLGYCLFELGNLQGTMVCCHEALNCAAIQKEQKLKWTGKITFLTQTAVDLSEISRVKV
jgi:hypothetical protein